MSIFAQNCMFSIAYFLWIVQLFQSGIHKRNIARQITIFRSKWQALKVPWDFITTVYEVVVKISKREVRMNFSWFEVSNINCTAPKAIFTTLIIDSTFQYIIIWLRLGFPKIWVRKRFQKRNPFLSCFERSNQSNSNIA